jgi:hypothetical protein
MAWIDMLFDLFFFFSGGFPKGFTSLNEQFAKLGNEGIESVTKHLNEYFGRLINTIVKHGGDVLKFAGDALICLFGTPKSCGTRQDDMEALVLQASRCALQIQEREGIYDAEGVKLTLHIGNYPRFLFLLLINCVSFSHSYLTRQALGYAHCIEKKKKTLFQSNLKHFSPSMDMTGRC